MLKCQVVALACYYLLGLNPRLGGGGYISRLGGPKKFGAQPRNAPVAPGVHSKLSNHSRHSKHSRLGRHNKRRKLSSSVARGEAGGGGRAPIGLKSMQNITFLVLLRPIFAPKMKITPRNGIGDQKLRKTCCDLNQKSGVLFSGLYLKLVGKNDWIWMMTFFYIFLEIT